MRILRFTGIVFLVFLAVVFTLPLLMKSTAETSHSITINAPAQIVFRQVNSFQNWQKWSPFETGDPEMISVYEGPAQGVGNKHSWKSDVMDDGSMINLQSEPYRFIQNLLDMNGNGKAYDEWTFTETADGVQVTWTLKMSELKYPFHRYFGFFIESLMRPMQEKGLTKLKEISEAIPPSVLITLEERPEILAVAIYDSATINQIEQLSKDLYKELKQSMRSGRVNEAGPAFAVYYNWTEDTPIRMRACFPVAEEVRESGRMNLYRLSGGKVLKAEWKGSYEGLGKVHLDMDAYMADFGMKLRGAGVWEEYIVGPEDNPNPSEWITHVFYPVE